MHGVPSAGTNAHQVPQRSELVLVVLVDQEVVPHQFDPRELRSGTGVRPLSNWSADRMRVRAARPSEDSRRRRVRSRHSGGQSIGQTR